MKLVVCGIAGKMGQLIVKCALAAGHQVVGGVEPAGSPLAGKTMPTPVAGVTVPVSTTLAAAAAAKPDAVIDFSAVTAAAANAAACAKLRLPLVVGTTGLGAKEKAALARAAKAVPVVFAPNMSLGVNVLLAVTEQVARTLGPGYDIDIVEAHHRLKKDAPSGTALGLAAAAARGRGYDLARVMCCGREGMVGARPQAEIGVLAVRGGDIVGEHTVVFAGDGERIELIHRAHSRETFARGAVRAAVWGKRAKRGLYSMREVLGLK